MIRNQNETETNETLRSERVRRAGVWALCAAAFVAAGLSAGCNTTRGAGEDLESAGEAISDTAEDAGAR
ncbi:MAG: entericidin A/B family lipoprotein [Phycisphaerales bacterium]|nr:MAG: entericidin A/B family lipoprotein [Phycisphaerales bacterium]